MKRKKILIIRGKNLNQWDLQMYEPLKDKYEIDIFVHPRNKFEINNIPFNNVRINDTLEFLRAPFSISKKNKQLYFYENELNRILPKYDIVHSAEVITNYTHSICRLKEKHRYKVITTVWENIPWKSIHSQFSNQIRNYVIDKIDFFIAPTNYSKNALLIEGIEENKIQTIYPGFDLSSFNSNENFELIKNKYKISENELVILFIGRLTFQKGIFDLLASIKHLIQFYNNSEFKVIIIGKGKESHKVNELIKRYNIEDKIILIQNLAYSEISKYYHISDVFVCPSLPEMNWQEQFGMVFAESMACGVPVLGGNSGAIPEVIKNSGLLSIPGNYIDLAEKLNQLLIDESLRKVYSANGKENAMKYYDSKKQSEEIDKIYSKLLES